MIGIVTVKTFLEMRLSEIIMILDQRIFLVSIKKRAIYFVVFPRYPKKIWCYFASDLKAITASSGCSFYFKRMCKFSLLGLIPHPMS